MAAAVLITNFILWIFSEAIQLYEQTTISIYGILLVKME